MSPGGIENVCREVDKDISTPSLFRYFIPFLASITKFAFSCKSLFNTMTNGVNSGQLSLKFTTIQKTLNELEEDSEV